MEQEERDDSSSESSSYSPKGGRHTGGFTSAINDLDKKKDGKRVLESNLDKEFENMDTQKVL